MYDEGDMILIMYLLNR